MSGERARAVMQWFEAEKEAPLDEADIAFVKQSGVYQRAALADAFADAAQPIVRLLERVLLRLVHVVERVEEWRGR